MKKRERGIERERRKRNSQKHRFIYNDGLKYYMNIYEEINVS